MTKQQKLLCKCWDCSIDGKPVYLACPKCGKNMAVGTPFSFWLRKKPELNSIKYGFDNQNLDYIWFAFYQAWFIIIEEKMYSAKSSDQQQDTHKIINQLLKAVPKGTKINTYRGFREIEYRGYYLVQFEQTNPDDSKWIKINGEKHSKIDLMYLLRCGELKALIPTRRYR